MQISNDELKERFFFCFSRPLADFLEKRGLSYIIKATDKKADRVYTLFDKTPALESALADWAKAKEEWRAKWFY
ncbi:hypothetical protein [Eubacterium maltosivorans]|uniref:DUF5659 domain-containing protein n=1 Tax=Eubacterium maltosivorans TaxID=2041044 RepID=A0A4P9C6B3_EUBML|nr:hypothetical protein [Eubacterium maltosivorans]QCT70125.1 hypothetical protein CPZ25_001960 [Eubacterium maltosivorans]